MFMYKVRSDIKKHRKRCTVKKFFCYKVIYLFTTLYYNVVIFFFIFGPSSFQYITIKIENYHNKLQV